MIGVMQYEWIIAVFLSVIYLLFPSVELLFMFNYGLQKSLISEDKFWSIWFILLFQISSLVTLYDLLVGNFANYFKITSDFWSKATTYVQSSAYLVEIILFSTYVISLSIDYGLIL